MRRFRRTVFRKREKGLRRLQDVCLHRFIPRASDPDFSPFHASGRPGTEFTSLPNAAPVPVHVAAASVGARQSSGPTSQRAVVSFGPNVSPLFASGGLSVAPTMYNSNKGTLPLSAGPGGAPSPPAINHAMLITNGMHSFSAPTPPSASSSASLP